MSTKRAKNVDDDEGKGARYRENFRAFFFALWLLSDAFRVKKKKVGTTRTTNRGKRIPSRANLANLASSLLSRRY